MIDRTQLLGSPKVPILELCIQAGALAELPRIMEKCFFFGIGYVICDQRTWKVAGQAIQDLKISGVGFHTIQSELPHCDRKTAQQLCNDVQDADFLIACGSGTINDLTKFTAHHLGVPFITVATAPSMNGYTSGIVALTEDGLKKTLPAPPAMALVADLDILCQAPLPMIRAGLGDLVSKPVCNADWKLSSLIRGEDFQETPFRLIADLEDQYLPKAKQLMDRDPEVMRALVEAIAYSGISMLLAGSSSPASGAEHLISHSMDMLRGLEDLPERDFHGTQVGIGTLTSIVLYQHFLKLRPEDIDWARAEQRWESMKAITPRLQQRWGNTTNAIVEAYSPKHRSMPEFREELQFIKNNWSEIQEAITPFIKDTPKIAHALHAANCKMHYSELDLTKAEYREIVLGARYIRGRYTILDLLDSIGMLEHCLDPFLAA